MAGATAMRPANWASGPVLEESQLRPARFPGQMLLVLTVAPPCY